MQLNCAVYGSRCPVLTVTLHQHQLAKPVDGDIHSPGNVSKRSVINSMLCSLPDPQMSVEGA